MKREGNVWIRIFPDKPITNKPAEVRMGKGKGNLEYYAAVVHPGRIMFEISGVSMEVAKGALALAAQKLPVATKMVIRRNYYRIKKVDNGKDKKNNQKSGNPGNEC